MPLRIRPVALAILCLFHLLTSKGQTTPVYSITNYNSDNALPQNSINDMAFDRNGFLWLTTGMGLVRFDGRNFREYNRENSPAMMTDRCAMLCRDWKSGTICIQPIFATSRFLKVTDDYQLKEDSALDAQPHQCIWDSYLFCYDHLYKKWADRDTIALGSLLKSLASNVEVSTVSATQAYVRKGLNYYFLDENAVQARLLQGITGHEQKIQFMVGEVYVAIDRQNRLYAYKGGVLQNITGSRQLMKLLSLVDVSGPYPIQTILKAIRDGDQTFLVHKGDIMKLNLTGGVVDYEVLAANTPIRNISCLIYDQKSRIIYAGTWTSGLYILKRQEFKRLFFSSDNFLINCFYAQVELSDRKVLTASGILDADSRTMNTLTPGIYDRPAFLRSSDGHIWYSSYGWVRRADTGLRHIDSIVNLGNVTDFGIWIASIIETPDKNILCCTETGQLYRIRGKKATLLLDAHALLKNVEMMSILMVDSNELWVGTGSGLYTFDLRHTILRRIPEMGNAAVRTMHKDRDGGIWLGTYGQGYYKYQKDRFIKMPMDAANNLNNVHCFMEDDQGYFWLPTNHGLYRVSKKELDSYASGGKNDVYYYYFDKASGFATNEFNGGCSPCGIVTRDGRFSLPSLDGLVQFYPDSITMIPPVAPIFIERLIAEGKKAITAQHFEQDQDSGPLTFSISSPYFGNPANLHLEYSISELDNKWHPVSEDGKLILTGLRKGRYTLTVRKQEGYSRYTYKSAQWTILPYWYETIWFRLLVAAVIISILFIIFYLRYSRQVRRTEELEKKVAERTEALSENNKVKEKMIAIILHDLRSPLRFLHMLATHIYESRQTVTGPEMDDMLRKFRNATRDLYEFAQDFVVWTNAQKEGFVVRQEKIVLRDIVGEIVTLYETGADIRSNNVLNLVPETITTTSDPHILKLIIRNLTDNANKYTHNGEIRIRAVEDNSSVRITITDTGRSMEKDLVEAILNNTYRPEDDNSGFGYKIILELLTKIHGRLLIDNTGTTGNKITLLFEPIRS